MIGQAIMLAWFGFMNIIMWIAEAMLPDSPFQGFYDMVLPEWAEWVVLFIPFQEMIAFFYVFMSFFVVWLGIRWGLARINMIGA